jgi:hypothetical protein
MKIRLDFVTNSSSSSFICLAQDVNFRDIIATQGVSPSGGKYVFLGDWLSDGRDHIELDLPKAQELCELIESGKTGDYFSYELFHVVDEAWDDGRLQFNDKSFEKALPSLGPCFVMACDVDYHGCENLEDIKRQYDKQDNY